MNELRALLQASRPALWVATALPFLVAALDAERGVSLALAIGALYFTGPFNLLINGLDSVATPTKNPVGARRLQIAIAASNLPFLLALVVLAGAAAGFALALAIAAAIAWTTPPLRTKERPVADTITAALLVVLPAVAGSLVGGKSMVELPWLALAALSAWVMASHALAAIRRLQANGSVGPASIATALGLRKTALFSLVAYGIAAALVATHGPLGALAALGLDLFLLLPAMILLAPRSDHAARDAAVGRAWQGFLGLVALVGVWLAALLLRHWDATGLTTWQLAIGVSTLSIGYAFLNLVAIRVATRRRRIRRDVEPEIESLTIVVPCRNEAERLPGCLAALLDQTYADTTILVVDDDSTDETAQVAAAVLGGAGRVVIAPPKPDGRTGKSWACQVGADASASALIMFVDSDTTLVPVATRIIVEQLQTRRLDLLSGLPRSAMPTTSERAAVPGFALLLLGFVPIWLSSLTRRSLPRAAFAHGSLVLVRREAYDAVGGHGGAADTPLEALDLARRFAMDGRRVGTVHAADLAATRLAPTTDAAIRGWRRMFLPFAGGSLALAIAVVALEILAYVAPLLLPPIALLRGVDARLLVASCVPLFLLGAMRLTLTLTQRQPLRTILWHPVTIGLTLIGQVAAIIDHVTGRPARWRGRSLAIASPTTAEPPV